MSKKQKTVVVSEFPQSRPIPVLEPAVKTGNGKATFKTATAAANAARDARDEARAALEEARELCRKSAGHVVKCMQIADEQDAQATEISTILRRDLVWKFALLVALVLNFGFGLFVLLTT